MGKRADHNGQRLARARLRRRWTQDRLARESGFSLATVRAIEQGRRSLDNMRGQEQDSDLGEVAARSITS